MAQITEDLVWSSTVSSTGGSNWERTVASNDSKASFAAQSGTTITFELTNLTHNPKSIVSVQQICEVNAQESQTVVVQNEILNGSYSQLYTQNLGWASNTDNSVSATVRTTSNGSAAWTKSDIDTMRIKCTWLAETGTVTTVLVDHYYVRVIYNAGNKISLNSGAIKLTYGKIQITEPTI